MLEGLSSFKALVLRTTWQRLGVIPGYKFLGPTYMAWISLDTVVQHCAAYS